MQVMFKSVLHVVLCLRYGVVFSIESTKSNRHVGHSECAHLIELMLQNTEHLSSYHKSQGVALLQEFEDIIAKSDDDLGQTKRWQTFRKQIRT